MLRLPVCLEQREAVAPPLDPRGGVALGDALQRHRRTRLHRLLRELEEQHRQSVCKKQTGIMYKVTLLNGKTSRWAKFEMFWQVVGRYHYCSC